MASHELEEFFRSFCWEGLRSAVLFPFLSCLPRKFEWYLRIAQGQAVKWRRWRIRLSEIVIFLGSRCTRGLSTVWAAAEKQAPPAPLPPSLRVASRDLGDMCTTQVCLRLGEPRDSVFRVDKKAGEITPGGTGRRTCGLVVTHGWERSDEMTGPTSTIRKETAEAQLSQELALKTD